MSDEFKPILLSDGSVHSGDPQVRAAQQREQLQRLSGTKPDPNAGRIGGLPLTARPSTTQQPAEKVQAAEQAAKAAEDAKRYAPRQLGESKQAYHDRRNGIAPPPPPGTLPGTIAPIPRGAAPTAAIPAALPAQKHAPLPTTDTAAGRVGDVREQQQHAQKIAAAIDPESQRIIEARYAALPAAEREKSSTQQAHFNDLLRLRDGQKIVGNVWVKPGAAPARDPDSGQFTAAPEDVSGLAPWAQAPGLTAVQKAMVQTGSEAEMSALYESGTPEQKAHWDGLATARETADAAAGWVPAGQMTVAELHGYTLPGFVLTETVKRDEMTAQLKAARAAGMSQAMVSDVMRNLLAAKK
jgi:hypothetical protein